MSGHGVVAIEPDRLEAFADALLRVADDVLTVRLRAYQLLEGFAAVPAGVHDLGPLAAQVRLLGLDTHRRLDIIRNLPWDDYPMRTSILLDRPVRAPYRAIDIARELDALGWEDGLWSDQAEEHLQRLLAEVAGDPYEAAALLNWLGVERFRRLYAVAERASWVESGQQEDRFVERCEAVTGILIAASRTVDHPGGLSRRFVDELFPDAPPPDADAMAETDPADLHVVQDILGTTDAGLYFTSAVQRAVGRGTGGLVTFGGRLVAVFGAYLGIGEALVNGGEGLVEAVATGALGLVGAFASGPIGWIAATASVVLTLVSLAPEAGPPPPRTYPPDRPNPGGAHYTHRVNEAGVPVAPNGM